MSVIVEYYNPIQAAGNAASPSALRPVLRETLNTVTGQMVTFQTPIPVHFQILRGYGEHFPERISHQTFRFEQPIFLGEVIQLVVFQ